MDKDLIHVLEKIANNLEQSNETLNRIADHYDGVVPVMTRNANRVEKAHIEVEEDNRSPLDKMYGQLFGDKEPETQN
jgi:methylphosphotriester-DNA--protein-cysteine methyltransferase